MTATYTFDVFPASTASEPRAVTGPATGASKGRSCSTIGSICTARISGWSSGRRPVSKALEGPLDWPDATLVAGDAVDVVARLKEESPVPVFGGAEDFDLELLERRTLDGNIEELVYLPTIH